MLGEICSALETWGVNNPPLAPRGAIVLGLIDDLTKVVTEPVRKYGNGSMEYRTLKKDIDAFQADVSVSISDPTIGMSSKTEEAQERERKTSRTFAEEDKVIFPTVVHLMKEILKNFGVSLYLLIDEWSSLPRELQPYLAEFFKRSFLPIPEVVIKIAALEFRSSFTRRNSANDIVGFELGSDIRAIDVDEYYIYDKSPDEVANAFADMLFRHLPVSGFSLFL
jgi:hypothetical protein